MKDIDKIISKGVCAVIPIYSDEFGNATKIMTKDGTSHLIDRTIRTILKLICQYYGVDIISTRKKYGKIINMRNVIPIPLSHNLVLIPFKMRRPISLKDGSYGYVNYFLIEEVYREEGQTIIKLKNNNKLKCLCELKTAKDHLNKGKIIVNDVSFKNQYNVNQSNYYHHREYDSPATKEDIAVLQKEIVEIKETLKKNR